MKDNVFDGFIVIDDDRVMQLEAGLSGLNL